MVIDPLLGGLRLAEVEGDFVAGSKRQPLISLGRAIPIAPFHFQLVMKVAARRECRGSPRPVRSRRGGPRRRARAGAARCHRCGRRARATRRSPYGTTSSTRCPRPGSASPDSGPVRTPDCRCTQVLRPDPAVVDKIVAMVAEAERPIVIGGGGGDAQSRPSSQPVLGLDYIPPGYGSGPNRI